MLADAAIELFLERGYEATSVTEITRRVGISRASYFNYFTSKAETLWYVLDERIEALEHALQASDTAFFEVFAASAGRPRPDTLALAIVDARTMGAEAELARGRADRQLRVADAITARLARDGQAPLEAAICGGGYAAAIFTALWAWAGRGAGRHSLDAELAEALAAARRVLA